MTLDDASHVYLKRYMLVHNRGGTGDRFAGSGRNTRRNGSVENDEKLETNDQGQSESQRVFLLVSTWIRCSSRVSPTFHDAHRADKIERERERESNELYVLRLSRVFVEKLHLSAEEIRQVPAPSICPARYTGYLACFRGRLNKLLTPENRRRLPVFVERCIIPRKQTARASAPRDGIYPRVVFARVKTLKVKTLNAISIRRVLVIADFPKETHGSLAETQPAISIIRRRCILEHASIIDRGVCRVFAAATATFSRRTH